MKLATEYNNKPDGTLLVVSKDLKLAVTATSIANTLQEALDNWQTISSRLQKIYQKLNEGNISNVRELSFLKLCAPLPRPCQWLDGSVFPTHGELNDHIPLFGVMEQRVSRAQSLQ